MTKFAAHTMVHDGLTSHSFAPGDELPEWAEGLVGEHVLVPEERTESDDSDGAGTSDESGAQGQDDGTDGETPGGDEDADGDGDDSNPPAADDQPDFTAPAPARRGTRSRK